MSRAVAGGCHLRPRLLLPEDLFRRTLDAGAAAALFERVAAQPVAERHRRDPPHVRGRHLAPAFERGECARGAGQSYLAAVAVHAQLQAKLRDPAEDRARDFRLRVERGRARDAAAEARLLRPGREVEGRGVAVERLAPLDDEDAAV